MISINNSQHFFFSSTVYLAFYSIGSNHKKEAVMDENYVAVPSFIFTFYVVIVLEADPSNGSCSRTSVIVSGTSC